MTAFARQRNSDPRASPPDPPETYGWNVAGVIATYKGNRGTIETDRLFKSLGKVR
jgi:hypothetical protein